MDKDETVDAAVSGDLTETQRQSEHETEESLDPPIPQVSTGARRRDPSELNWRQRNTSREASYRRRHHHKGQTQSKDNVFVSSKSGGIGKETDEVDLDVNLYGTNKQISRAEEHFKGFIKNLNISSHHQEQLTINLPDTAKTNSDDNPTIDCKTLCEQYNKYKSEQYSKLPPIVKDFYIEDPIVAAIPTEEVIFWRKESHDMKIRRNSHDAANLRPIPNPALSFEQLFRNYPDILEVIHQAGFMRPYPIQSQAWPVLLRGEDLICIAPNGTGKTLAVLLSALIHIDGQPTPRMERKGPLALFMVSNRKMIFDVQDELLKIRYRGIRYVSLYKEGDRNMQIKILSKGVDMVLATPGRLIDLAMGRYLRFLNFTYVAILEADSIIDMGYDAQIRRALSNMRPDKQMVMTCATWAIGVRLLALSYMKDPIQIKLGALDSTSQQTMMTQRIQYVEEAEKEKFVMHFLDNMIPTDKVIIFCGITVTAEHIGKELSSKGIEYRALHGDSDPTDYEVALKDVVHGSVNILLITNLASRNINLEHLNHVINLDYPGQIEEYVDRVDRTGRAGGSGTALTYVTRKDFAHAHDLILILKEAQQAIPDELEQMARKFEAMTIMGRGRGGRGQRARGMVYRGALRSLN